jgi:predicted nucleic acid-binding protein
MAMKRFLLDTNAIIDYVAGILPVKAITWLDSIVDTEAAMSIINQIEILGFNPDNPADMIPFEELVATLEILSLNDTVAKSTIDLRKSYKIKLPDAIIAATALTHGLSLVSRNKADFQKIPNLTLINLHDMV